MIEHPEAAPVPTPRKTPAAPRLPGMDPLILGALVALGWLIIADGRSRIVVNPVLSAIVRLVVFALAGWVAVRLLRLALAALDQFAAQVEAIARLSATAERLADALERAGSPTATTSTAGTAPPPATADPRTLAMAEVRDAIRQGQWIQAGSLIQGLADAFPDDPAAARLQDELAESKAAAVADLRARIEACREADNPDQLLVVREAIAPLLDPDSLRTLDRDLARWLMGRLQKRLRNGVMTIDVAALAGRVADIFHSTPEGVSLRAALPTLRRSAGLCARCGQPYTGIADACPACLVTNSFSAFVPAPATPTSNGGPARPSGPATSGAITTEPG